MGSTVRVPPFLDISSPETRESQQIWSSSQLSTSLLGGANPKHVVFFHVEKEEETNGKATVIRGNTCGCFI